MRQRRMVSFRGGQGGSRTAPTGEGMDSGSGGPGSAGGCAFRRDGFLPPRGVRLQEGWIPASAGMTDGEGVGVGGLM